MVVPASEALEVGVAGWDRRPFLIAHRGFSSAAPENTLVAFERALEAGAEVLECDVQLTRDGVLIVFHDPKVDRTTDGSGPVRGFRWEEIRTLDAGYARRFADGFRGERVPRLVDVLDLARGRADVFVEIKPEAVDGSEDGVEARTVQAARSTDMLSGIGVLSFAPRALSRVKALAPRVPLGRVFRWWRRRHLVEEALSVQADYAVVYAARLLADPGIVEQAHARGLRVGAYVADTAEVVSRLVESGVDGIATNRIGDLIPAFTDITNR